VESGDTPVPAELGSIRGGDAPVADTSEGVQLADSSVWSGDTPVAAETKKTTASATPRRRCLERHILTATTYRGSDALVADTSKMHVLFDSNA